MIPIDIAKKVAIPLAIFCAVVGIFNLLHALYSLPSPEARRRSDTTYVQKIVEVAPGMADRFSVAGVEIKNKHWVIVTVKNNQNSDTLRTLMYDPNYSATDMQVVSPPGTRVSFDSLMSKASITAPKDTPDDATE